MILQIIVLIGMLAFCVWQFVEQINVPGPVYIPLIYVICPILLLVGLGKRGVFTWPLVTVLLLIEGHWIVGWIPAVLVAFTVIGNEWLNKKYPTHCTVCGEAFEDGQELRRLGNTQMHAGQCYKQFLTDSNQEGRSD